MSYSDQLASRDQFGQMSWTAFADGNLPPNAVVANEKRLATSHCDEPSMA
jgi:hypothetical protein